VDTGPVALAEGLLRESFTALHDAGGPAASPDDLVAVLRLAAAAEREAQRVTVETVAAMQQRGVFAEHGQRPQTALCGLLGIETIEARRIVTAAELASRGSSCTGRSYPRCYPGPPASTPRPSCTAGAPKLIDMLDQDGAEPDDDREPEQINELC
jgi:hypothetical protein